LEGRKGKAATMTRGKGEATHFLIFRGRGKGESDTLGNAPVLRVKIQKEARRLFVHGGGGVLGGGGGGGGIFGINPDLDQQRLILSSPSRPPAPRPGGRGKGKELRRSKKTTLPPVLFSSLSTSSGAKKKMEKALGRRRKLRSAPSSR